MSLVSDLRALGFAPMTPRGVGDFRVQDDLDGKGAQIVEWSSAKPCPFPERLRQQESPEPE